MIERFHFLKLASYYISKPFPLFFIKRLGVQHNYASNYNIILIAFPPEAATHRSRRLAGSLWVVMVHAEWVDKLHPSEGKKTAIRIKKDDKRAQGADFPWTSPEI